MSQVRAQLVSFSPGEEAIVLRLGAAVARQWISLPGDVQALLRQQANAIELLDHPLNQASAQIDQFLIGRRSGAGR